MSLKFLSRPNIKQSSTPPASAIDGDIWIYSGVSGMRWQFIRDAAADATYPWHFIGGPPLVVSLDSDRGTSGGVGWWTDLTLTIPRAGRYLLAHQMDMYVDDIHSTYQIQWLAYLGDGSSVFASSDSYLRYYFNAAGSTAFAHGVTLSRDFKDYGALAASTTVRQWISAPQGWDFIAGNRSISAVPMRIS